MAAVTTRSMSDTKKTINLLTNEVKRLKDELFYSTIRTHYLEKERILLKEKVLEFKSLANINMDLVSIGLQWKYDKRVQTEFDKVHALVQALMDEQRVYWNEEEEKSDEDDEFDIEEYSVPQLSLGRFCPSQEKENSQGTKRAGCQDDSDSDNELISKAKKRRKLYVEDDVNLCERHGLGKCPQTKKSNHSKRPSSKSNNFVKQTPQRLCDSLSTEPPPPNSDSTFEKDGIRQLSCKKILRNYILQREKLSNGNSKKELKDCTDGPVEKNLQIVSTQPDAALPSWTCSNLLKTFSSVYSRKVSNSGRRKQVLTPKDDLPSTYEDI